jgi:23S rRNA pseudouridine2605 synthase
LSKLGFCSRSQAISLVLEGRVRVNGKICRDPGSGVDLARDRFEVDGQTIRNAAKIYLMLNKPRGLLTTLSDEQGRRTVFECLPRDVPFVTPVGRLDQASEGLLLFTNDTAWAASIMDPEAHTPKTYHVQVNRVIEPEVAQRLVAGLTDQGEFLSAKTVTVLRQGSQTSWLEIILEEGKNRQIRRMFESLGIDVLRLIRVAIGSLKLGALPKGSVRSLTPEEVRALQR